MQLTLRFQRAGAAEQQVLYLHIGVPEVGVQPLGGHNRLGPRHARTTPDAALVAAAFATADDMAVKHVVIPNRVIDSDSDAPHPTSAVHAHPTLPYKFPRKL